MISHTTHSHTRLRALPAILFILLLSAASARAGLIGTTVTLDFDNADGQSASYSVDLSNLNASNDYTWDFNNADSPLIISDGDTVLAKIKMLHVHIENDPSVFLSFGIANGTSIPTTVTVTSGIVNFTPLVNPTAFASASMTVTDGDSSLDGASVTGVLGGGTGSYEAQYDGLSGTQAFADLIPSVTTTTDNSSSLSARYPVSGGVIINDTVSSIHSQFQFNLSAFDSASGSSRFDVSQTVPAPEPASVVLAGLGFLGLTVAAWRRKSRTRIEAA